MMSAPFVDVNPTTPRLLSDPSDATKIGVPAAAVMFRPYPDLSDQVLTAAPLAGAAPVPSGSPPSSHSASEVALLNSKPPVAVPPVMAAGA